MDTPKIMMKQKMNKLFIISSFIIRNNMTNKCDFDTSEIIPHLWVGNSRSAKNKTFILEKNIKYIINLTKSTPNYFSKYNDIKYLNIYINDEFSTCVDNMENTFDRTNEFIIEAFKNNKSILVHCDFGTNVSSAIVASFMIRYLNLDYLSTIIFIQSVRKCSFTKKTCILNALYNYYISLNKKN
jgi:protein-tyrosine phosphatase